MRRVSVDLVRKLVEDGKTLSQIAQETNESNSYIYNIIRYYKINYKRPSSAADLSKNKYERLQPLEIVPPPRQIKGKYKYWRCECDCGNFVEVSSNNLTSGRTVSCGCYNKEAASKRKWGGYEEISGSDFSNLKGQAKYREIEFDLNIEYLWDLYIKQDRKCAISGLAIEFTRKKKDRKVKKTTSLDRIDSSKGYVQGNVQWVHKTINLMKHTLSQDEFVSFCKSVAENN